VQTALVRAYQRWDKIRQADPVGYVRTCLLNARTDWWRRRSSREWPVADAAVERSAFGDLAASVASRHAVLQALALLNRRERQVIVLRYYADLTVPEIAATLGMPAGSVKSMCARALAKLRVSPEFAEFPADGMEDTA
jgi:RNA polymerase sigma factor (sigma-70 family)